MLITIRYSAAVLSAVLLWAAGMPCAAQSPTRVQKSFQASFEAGPGGLSLRRPGEYVAVYDGISPEANVFRIKALAGGKYSLEGKVSEGARSFVAVCPYEAFRGVSGDTLRVNVPSRQTISSGKSVDSKACVAVGVSSGDSFTFTNLISFAKFKVTGEKVRGVSLSYACAGEIPLVSSKPVLSGVRHDGVTVEPGGDAFAPGEYYAALIPQTLKGQLVTCKTDTLTRWAHEDSRKYAYKRNSVVEMKNAEDGNVLLAKWRFSPEMMKDTRHSFSSWSRKRGGAGKTIPSNVAGKGILDFCQDDVDGRSDNYAKRKINDKSHPEVTYVWKGDYWRFRVEDTFLREGTTLHIRYTTRVSGRGMKHWRLEAYDGKEWINPQPSYGKASEADGEPYSIANTPDGETVDCTWTISTPCKGVQFRMVCASRWSYMATDSGPGLISEPISSACSITDTGDGKSDTGPYIEIVKQ